MWRFLVRTTIILIIQIAIFAQSVALANDDFTLRRVNVPILMYHYVGDTPADADIYRVDLTVSAERFRDHIEYLATGGYTTISFYDLDEALNSGTPLPEKPVILTFDDGHIDHYEAVFPVLQEFNMTGTFFLVTGRMDAADPAYVTWEHVTEMAEAGMSMEAHTKNHPDLRERPQDFLTYEILGSVESIEAYTGQRPRVFAYPGGRYDAAAVAVLSSTEILHAVTTEFG
ncbi:MAG: polysaccharide deacetylase family protein, partial [Chloroflexota bacterium]